MGLESIDVKTEMPQEVLFTTTVDIIKKFQFSVHVYTMHPATDHHMHPQATQD